MQKLCFQYVCLNMGNFDMATATNNKRKVVSLTLDKYKITVFPFNVMSFWFIFFCHEIDETKSVSHSISLAGGRSDKSIFH